jgi:mannose-6-phosphate isomerase-like protein (cupin superfamily)
MLLLAAPRNTLDATKGVVTMLLPGRAHTVVAGQGRSVDLGVVSMRLLAGGQADTGGTFSLAEFSGTGEGAWTVPHLHRGFEESFFVLDGSFTFTVGEEAIEATPGMYILVPRGTTHTISAAAGGGRFLTLMVPGGLEEMFFELGTLPPNAIRDPAARVAVSARYDSIPVTP